MAAQISVQVLIQYLGLISQAATVLLLVVLFVLLRRYADRRAYFHAWSNAWIALAAALTVLVFRYILLPRLSGAPAPEDSALVRACYFLYQFGKLAFLILLLRGTLLYVGGLANPPLGYVNYLWVVALAVAAASVLATHDAVGVLFWQATANMLMSGGCGVILLLLPRARRSLGTRFTAVVLLLNMLLWTLYVLAFTHHFFPQLGVGRAVWGFFSGRNTFFDLILEMLLAFGMVLVLFEDARREIDSAHRELRIAHEQLLRESYLDSLTGAYNRRAFSEGAGLEDARGSFGALAVFDLDNLKDVNDRHGHKYGDGLLQHFANVLRAGLRANDKLYRLGGDEFLLLMPRAVAEVVEKRMRELISNAPPAEFPEAGLTFPVSASIGVADFKSVDQLEAAVHDADRNMYKAKRSRKRGP
ncbi:MAG TPA: GGDEF domain-containing protein [Gammaproteobacteria bacterium]|nr:GGDEF domain-containing protein [Gammaproteobacteria bacterium]